MKVGNKIGARFELSPDSENLIGRDWECDVALNDPQCSRVHAAISYKSSSWWITDRKSSNGTYINGQVIRDSYAQLIDGTEIKLGSHQFTFASTATAVDQLSNPIAESDTSQTVVLENSLSPGETGQYTLDFLRGHSWGEDFFFLFQLSVRLLEVDTPEEACRLCLERLFQRTHASIAGFLWLGEDEKLAPKLVLPEKDAEKIKLNNALTRKVVREMQAIRIEHDTVESPKKIADSICVPLIWDAKVEGAIHLYRESQKFNNDHFKLAGAVANIMVKTLQRTNRQASVVAERDRLSSKSADFSELIGESKPMEELKAKIKRVAQASGCVLVRGESGAGKELVARALHRAGNRADRPMLSVNCAAIPADLMESQLFGHKKGAFTSAESDHIGWFQQADLGTLFLDEIGELTLEGQAKLLRILEGHPFLPVGGTKEISVDVRVICATNRNLADFVAEKKFREDLFYRLSVFELQIPPLRERGPDIQRLIDHFFVHFCKQHGRGELKISAEANDRMLGYHWPGNVRQLRNVIDSAVVMAETDEIQLNDLGIREATQVSDELECLLIDHWERKLIQEALKRTAGNIPKAAKLLGVSRATLYRKVEDYGIER